MLEIPAHQHIHPLHGSDRDMFRIRTTCLGDGAFLNVASGKLVCFIIEEDPLGLGETRLLKKLPHFRRRLSQFTDSDVRENGEVAAAAQSLRSCSE